MWSGSCLHSSPTTVAPDKRMLQQHLLSLHCSSMPCCAHLKGSVLERASAWNTSPISFHLLTRLSFRSLLKCHLWREALLNYTQMYSSTLTCFIFFTVLITIYSYFIYALVYCVSLPPTQLECKFYWSSNLAWFIAVTLVSRTMPTHRRCSINVS